MIQGTLHILQDMLHPARHFRARLPPSRLILAAEVAGADSSNSPLKSQLIINHVTTCTSLTLITVNSSRNFHRMATHPPGQHPTSRETMPIPLQLAPQRALVHSSLPAGATEVHRADIIEATVQVLAAAAAAVGSRAVIGDLAAAAPEQPPVSRKMQAQVVALLRQHQTLVIMHRSRAMPGRRMQRTPSGPQRSCKLKTPPTMSRAKRRLCPRRVGRHQPVLQQKRRSVSP